MDPINPISGNPEAIGSVPNTPQPLPSPKDSHWITILSMAIFVLLSLGAVAFLYYQNQQLKEMLSSYQTPIASPTPSVTADPTANWKTYTDNLVGFELKYPTDKFKITTNPPKLVNTILPSDNDGWLYIDISADKLTEPVTVDDWVNNNWPNQDKSVKKNIKIDGVDAIIFDGGNVEPKSNKYMFIIKGSNIIQISAHYLNFSVNQGGGKNPYYDQIINIWTNDVDQILSTFKFTDATPSSSPVTCTMEAKICPDGSSVGRTGPNCEFATCPSSY